eukprot:TRINITY_DN7221_c0_g4_i1.p1 TRINITY_DN7221_c0_g4~~TRINITY_DN7221_c0_g4_i1.p1  ORF type:complete len:150 (+),score=3.48 TRINITY_DN7221_c0_g4_i1:73-522(+)
MCIRDRYITWMLSGINLKACIRLDSGGSTARPAENYSRPSMIRVYPEIKFKTFKNLNASRPQTSVGSFVDYISTNQDSTSELSEFFFLTNVDGMEGEKTEKMKEEPGSRNFSKVKLDKAVRTHREFLKSTYHTDAYLTKAKAFRIRRIV